MDCNLYAIEKIVAIRLADLRAARAQAALAESLQRPRRGLGPVVGAALIRVGRRLLRDHVAPANGEVRVAR